MFRFEEPAYLYLLLLLPLLVAFYLFSNYILDINISRSSNLPTNNNLSSSTENFTSYS